MSFTETEKHWLLGCTAATAESKSDVNVAMPHLRGKWSPTNAILRILETSSMRQSFISHAPRSFAQEPVRQSRMCRLRALSGKECFSGAWIPSFERWFSRDPALPIRCRWQERAKDIHADAVIASRAQPSDPSTRLNPCRARCHFTPQNHCTSHRDWRSDS